MGGEEDKNTAIKHKTDIGWNSSLSIGRITGFRMNIGVNTLIHVPNCLQ